MDKDQGCQEGEKSELRGLQKAWLMGLIEGLRCQESSPPAASPVPPLWCSPSLGLNLPFVENVEVGPSNWFAQPSLEAESGAVTLPCNPMVSPMAMHLLQLQRRTDRGAVWVGWVVGAGCSGDLLGQLGQSRPQRTHQTWLGRGGRGEGAPQANQKMGCRLRLGVRSSFLE